MRRSYFIYILIALCLLASCGVERSLKKAEEHLAIGEYYDAAAMFKKAYQQTPAKNRNERGLYAIKMAKGEDLGTEETVSDGTYDVPAVVLEPVAVNKDNMDEVIIDSGYHLREDVYLNVPAG